LQLSIFFSMWISLISGRHFMIGGV